MPNQKIPTFLLQRKPLPFSPGFPSRPACPVQRKRLSGTSKKAPQLSCLSPKWSTALKLRGAFHHKAFHLMQCFLHLKEILAAVTEDPGSIHSKLNCRTFFLSVQTNHSCLTERPRITTSMTPLSCCFLVCAHRNKIWVAVTLRHI